jgi:sortase (surface protein transpeptidase)
MVLVGHVDTYRGPAVFYRLTGVRRGDRVHVVRADGSLATFVISKITIVRKTAFPSNAVFRPTANPAIRLITCTGFFDTQTRHYIDSLVLWGKPAT